MAEGQASALECMTAFAQEASTMDLYQESCRHYFVDILDKPVSSQNLLYVGPTLPMTPRPEVDSRLLAFPFPLQIDSLGGNSIEHYGLSEKGRRDTSTLTDAACQVHDDIGHQLVSISQLCTA